jgi:formylglycine-generating enzyme required for sulfatase activity
LTAIVFLLFLSGCHKPTELEQVSKPVFSPPGGTYDSAVEVVITTSTLGTTILYTTDGSDPDLNSPVYAGPILVSETITLKAKAYRTGMQDSAIATASYTIELPPPPDQMIYVPGGTFTMGDTRGYVNELPTHTVTLNSFYIGKYEVTQAEYSQYMQPGSSWRSDYGLGDNYPAYYVSWYAILKYCNLRSMAEGLIPCYTINGSTNPANWGAVPTDYNDAWDAAICDWNANGYRLPTEAEWEYAARGATNNPDYLYSGSDDINAVAWYESNSGQTSHPVGTKAPNGIGTYDMSGNVYEWCWDWYGYGYYSSSPQNNPTGPASGSYRMVRCGGWIDSAGGCQVARRSNHVPSCGSYVVGFRLCRSAT